VARRRITHTEVDTTEEQRLEQERAELNARRAARRERLMNDEFTVDGRPRGDTRSAIQ
jgi:hypothetical protein